MIDKLTVTVLAEDSVGYESSCLGQHGLSLLIDTWADDKAFRCRVLMDVVQHGLSRQSGNPEFR